jgi:predicted dinucleotide-binding enzyme
MKIAVISSGHVGGTLGRRWAQLGHQVVFGVRDPARSAGAVKGGDGIDAPLPASARVAAPLEAVLGTEKDADDRAEVVLLATPWNAIARAIGDLGSNALAGVALLDATSPIAPGLRVDVDPDGASGAERVQALAKRPRGEDLQHHRL